MIDNPTPEQMARRIADARYSSSERPGSWMVAYDAALSAIIETTELAAKEADKHARLAARKQALEEAAQKAVSIGEQYGEDETGWFECSETIATAIRALSDSHVDQD